MAFRLIVGLLYLIIGYTQTASIGGSSKDYDTIVIGLGSAGTTAASTLARAGRRVLALEAQDRVGGRVHTVPFGDGIMELGAEWIHGTKSSRVYELALQNNFTVLPQDFEPKLYYGFKGKEVDGVLFMELINYALKVQGETPSEPLPLGQFITDRVFDYLKEKHPSVLMDKEFLNQYLHFIDTMVDSNEGTTCWNETTTASEYEELEGNQYMSWHRLGYKTFFDVLLNKHNNGSGLPTLDIELKKEVTKITWSQDPTKKVEVRCKDGSTYTADNVIITVSLGVLKERHETLFLPHLNEEKTTAIDKMSIGVVGKIVLLYSEKWWPQSNAFGFIWTLEEEQKLPDEDKWLYNVTNASETMGNTNSLVFWSCGNTAKLIETLPDDLVKRKVTELLRKFIGPHINTTIPEPVAMLRTYWHTNPYTRGTYTYDNLLTPQYPTARSDLAEPITDSSGNPRILFAGEATNSIHFGTVHGASETGFREATRLLQKSS
ncbi:spermine oxidase-like [Galleria mellonella]|uniref:Spermine oxidase-like n=1 Tax=Galleria mellonella TaxID=7137 RepID=A0ABM3MAH6_GALME|nr:spermine oxidase-like [Galleria mellonella]